jgi:hypothetical protein
MKKTMIIVIIAGMSVRLSLGITAPPPDKQTKEVPAISASSIKDNSADEVLQSNKLSVNMCGIDDYRLNALAAELNAGGDTEDMYIIWGRISVRLGELNSRILAQTVSAEQKADETEVIGYTNTGIYDITNYPLEAWAR